MFVVFDLDGTLCNIEHRLHHIEGEKKDWPAFFAACVDDKPIWELIDTLWALHATGHRIEIWSGRSDEVRVQTELWLRDQEVTVDRLRMRTAGDHQPDVSLKRSWLMEEEQKPDLIFDDRQCVVDMWRAEGIRCAQVAPGEF